MKSNLQNDIVLAMMKVLLVDQENATIDKIYNSLKRFSLHDISQRELLRELSTMVRNDMLNLSDTEYEVKYKLSMELILEHLKHFEEFGYNFATNRKFSENAELQEIKSAILFRMLERTVLRDLDCSFQNFAGSIASRDENQERNYNLIRIAVLSLYDENKIIITKNENGDMLYSINPDIINQTKKQYYDFILNEYFSLKKEHQDFLIHCRHLTKTKKLNGLLLDNPEIQTKMDDIVYLEQKGLVYRVKDFRKNDTIIFKTPHVLPTFTGAYVVDFVQKYKITENNMHYTKDKAITNDEKF